MEIAGVAVGDGVGEAVGMAVGEAVGGVVGGAVGGSVDGRVGETVGAVVGEAVVMMVGADVGETVGLLTGDCVSFRFPAGSRTMSKMIRMIRHSTAGISHFGIGLRGGFPLEDPVVSSGQPQTSAGGELGMPKGSGTFCVCPVSRDSSHSSMTQSFFFFLAILLTPISCGGNRLFAYVFLFPGAGKG